MSKDTLPNSWTKTTRVIPAHFPREPSTVRDPNDRLCLVLDDYQTAENVSPHALTLALTHGTSFNKAFWELVLADLLSEAPSNHIVRRAIAIDVVNHGDSAVRNADKLGVNGTCPSLNHFIPVHCKIQSDENSLLAGHFSRYPENTRRPVSPRPGGWYWAFVWRRYSVRCCIPERQELH